MIETIKIRTAPSHGNPEGSITINKCDFCAGEHELFDEESSRKFSQEELDAINKQLEEDGEDEDDELTEEEKAAQAAEDERLSDEEKAAKAKAKKAKTKKNKGHK